MKRTLLFTITAAAFVASPPASAKAMKWMDAAGAGLPAGAQMAVVKGDPSKAGEFTIRVKMPAGYTVPPHSHPGDEVVRVVTGGPLHYGMGDKLVMANAGTLEKGYHVTMAAGMNHWAHAPVATVVQVEGKGPFGITYVNPADDPRKK
jgi:quercetin dioxygenase-like cupin family protein